MPFFCIRSGGVCRQGIQCVLRKRHPAKGKRQNGSSGRPVRNRANRFESRTCVGCAQRRANPFFRGVVFEPRWCPCFFTAQQVRSFVVCVTEGESFFSRSSLRTSWVSVFFDSSTSSVVCRTCGVQHFVYSSIAAVSVLRLGVDEGVL